MRTLPRSRHAAFLVCLVLLVFCGCKWDLWGIVTRATVEDRVRECLGGGISAPAAVEVNGDSFGFAVFGDPQVGHDYKSRLGRFRQEAAARGLAFFCVLGDLTEDATSDEADTVKLQLDRIGIPYYATIGNHDLYQADGWPRFKDDYGPSCYSVVIAERVKLIFLDTADGALGPTQFNWFETELKDARFIKLVLTHYPLYDGKKPFMWRMASVTERAKVQGLLAMHRAWAWCAGHMHAFRYTPVDQVRHLTCGAMAPVLDYGDAGYLLFTFAHDSLSWQFVKLN
ncbi:hypothetical protein FJY70_05880 [candidate division WOR-3 bacterium]|nr:hypothetical protein [candidate division WOR-3 bacterium]